MTTPGTYYIRVTGPVPATSPPFRIDTGVALYAPLLTEQLFFFQTQRDGTNVTAAVMHRQPAYRTDAAACTYAPPHYNAKGVLQGDLQRLGNAKRDVAGGWFDAGDYLKFTHTTAYVLAGMLLSRRDYPGVPAGFAAEARFGLRWLMQMWDDDQRVLYYQVGIGEGNGDTILGDHDFWRLPEKDDQRRIDINDTDHPAYYVKFRPVLRANAPGQRLTPNLAGRIAAALALCYQVYQHSHPQFAETCLTYADHVYNQADTAPAAIFAASPTAFYPEDEWHSDLELGAVELYLAITARGSAAGLSHSANAYLRQAAHWARQYIDKSSGDSLNVYDVSALAHYELHRALTQAGTLSGVEVTRANLLNSMREQLDAGVARADRDAFGFGFDYGEFDATTHTLGYIATAFLYRQLTNSEEYAEFAQQQVDYLLGKNAWGTSFIVGAGTTFPQCLHHQVANLAGALDGSAPIVLGAAVNGPNGRDNFTEISLPDGARKCPRGDTFKSFTGRGTRYMDHPGAWPSSEPAIDFNALTVIVFADLINR